MDQLKRNPQWSVVCPKRMILLVIVLELLGEAMLEEVDSEVVEVVVVVVAIVVVIMAVVDTNSVKEVVWTLVIMLDQNEVVLEEGVHVSEVGDEVVAEEDQLLFVTLLINQLSGMGSSVGSTKERVDVVGVGLPLKIVWKK